jgi:hypothetical protein
MELKKGFGRRCHQHAGLPRQFILERGKQITYIDVVVNAAEGSK